MRDVPAGRSAKRPAGLRCFFSFVSSFVSNGWPPFRRSGFRGGFFVLGRVGAVLLNCHFLLLKVFLTFQKDGYQHPRLGSRSYRQPEPEHRNQADGGAGVGMTRVAQFILSQTDIRECVPSLINRDNVI